MFPYTITPTTLIAHIDGKPYMTDRSNPRWPDIKELLNDPDTTSDQLINAIKPINAIAEALHGQVAVEISGSSVLVDGVEISGHLADRLLDIVAEGLDVTPWIAFVQNIWANPFTEAREELYTWLERGKMPITPDGCFLAYKVVRSNFLDRWSGTIRYAVGDTPSMPRENCDNSSRALCSSGLHFCSAEYLPGFGINNGDHVMMVKINPADVVSIPHSETHKGRAWRMEVVGEIDPKLAGIHNWAPIDDTWDVPDAEVKGADDLAGHIIKTANYGDITPASLTGLKEAHGGTWAGVAKAVGAPVGTVSGWASTFRKKGITI